MDWVERAKKAALSIARAADEIEASRALPASLLDTLHDLEAFRILLPRSCGGGEADPVSFCAFMEELAKADASAAWCVGQAAGCAFSAAYIEQNAASEVFSDRSAVLAWGPASHHSRAIAVDGGYRLTGSWSYASGSRHATWLGAHIAVFETDGSPRQDENGKHVEKTMLFPRSSARMTDVWQVMGLRGTGSDNYAVTDLFVPKRLTYVRDSERDRRENGPLYRFGVISVFAMAFSSLAIGVAAASLDAFIGLAAEKTPKGGSQALRENSVVQSLTGLSRARLLASRAQLREAVASMWTVAREGKTFSLEQRVDFRLAVTYAIHQSRQIVEELYAAAGATAIFENRPFERRFRDIHAVAQQIQGHASNFETAGQVLLGSSGPKPRI